MAEKIGRREREREMAEKIGRIERERWLRRWLRR